MNKSYHKNDALDIFRSALKAVDPYRLVSSYAGKVRSAYQSTRARRLVIVGFGKAAITMGKAVEDSLHDIITDGILITKHGHYSKEVPLRKLRVFEAGHPIPDEYGYAGTDKVIRLLQKTDAHTLVLCLISGGGSALLVSPYTGITLQAKQHVSELLLKAGADITELNTVRKHISTVKGGRLAEIVYPARILSLIISDVIGDRLDVIASGPTAPDSTTYEDAIRVLGKYDLIDRVPGPVMEILRKGVAGIIPETPKKDNPLFSCIENMIIGSNTIALSKAKQKAEEMGFSAEILSSEIQGEARDVGKWLAKRAVDAKKGNNSPLPCCLISGGETTVTVEGTGLGGRNMELALAFAMEINGIEGITLVSAGTDGTDGPTDATGAIVDGNTVEKARTLGLDPLVYLDNNDSYNFFKEIDGLLVTGPTGTNVMDIQILIIE